MKESQSRLFKWTCYYFGQSAFTPAGNFLRDGLEHTQNRPTKGEAASIDIHDSLSYVSWEFFLSLLPRQHFLVENVPGIIENCRHRVGCLAVCVWELATKITADTREGLRGYGKGTNNVCHKILEIRIRSWVNPGQGILHEASCQRGYAQGIAVDLSIKKWWSWEQVRPSGSRACVLSHVLSHLDKSPLFRLQAASFWIWSKG